MRVAQFDAVLGGPPRIRRAHSLIAWYEGDELVVENYLTGCQTILHPAVLRAAAAFDAPVSHARALAQLGGSGAAQLLDELVRQQILVEVGRDLERWDRAVDDSWPWGHEARWFHYRTRRTRFVYDLQRERDDLVQRARLVPQPPPCKDLTDSRPTVSLPGAQPPTATLGEVLRRRRTGRAFGHGSLSLQELSTVLALTWGITELRNDPGIGVVAMKTSPSGGARHPVEVYCVAQRVEGLAPGAYHYCASRHALSLISQGSCDLDARALRVFTDQPWVQDAAALFVMTAVTSRSGWKYPQSHAYRVAMLDAGHLGQTFHLVCTALGISPWTSAALDEPAAERLLGIEDPSEAVIYGAACGWPAPGC